MIDRLLLKKSHECIYAEDPCNHSKDAAEYVGQNRDSQCVDE